MDAASTGHTGTVLLRAQHAVAGRRRHLPAHRNGNAAAALSVTAFPLQLVSIAIVSLTQTRGASTAFPRWIGYLTVWQALQSFGGLVAMLFKSDPLAWGGLIPFYFPLTLFFVWVIAISYTLLRAIREQEGSQPADSAVAT